MQQTTILNIFHCFSEKINLDISSENLKIEFETLDQNFKLRYEAVNLYWTTTYFAFSLLRISWAQLFKTNDVVS